MNVSNFQPTKCCFFGNRWIKIYEFESIGRKGNIKSISIIPYLLVSKKTQNKTQRKQRNKVMAKPITDEDEFNLAVD